MPRFSIIITCYNQAGFIKDAVESALAQPTPDKEVIVVDDCSTDESRQILRGYGDSIRFKPVETNQGPSSARNLGASLATGDYLVFLDGDDALLPWALETYSRVIETKRPKLIMGSMVWFENSLASVKREELSREIVVVEYESFMKKDRSWRASASALVVDRTSFGEAGGWPPGLWPMDDHDLVLRLGYAGVAVQIFSPQTTAYRVHTGNIVHQSQKMVGGALALMEREKTGLYPGGRACRFERYARIGGVAYFCLGIAWRTRLFRNGIRLISAGWLFILATMLSKAGTLFSGRRPLEKLGMVS